MSYLQKSHREPLCPAALQLRPSPLTTRPAPPVHDHGTGPEQSSLASSEFTGRAQNLHLLSLLFNETWSHARIPGNLSLMHTNLLRAGERAGQKCHRKLGQGSASVGCGNSTSIDREALRETTNRHASNGGRGSECGCLGSLISAKVSAIGYRAVFLRA
ncbi:hypothetical protein P154DRAFT_567047 [Amniculicola lignicola CBS 123094]|uniref:Uncharacterized protein n=1 Tax=Amniculicola lignicola CBS 123094 TaxID=1392246 RepID=A0A6A5VZF6_9PLEO|nr:hypothetical protein P154DRAFT_567047 [Amniculicola lignicola CBS 123094]